MRQFEGDIDLKRRLKLNPVTGRTLKCYQVEQNCMLKDFIKDHGPNVIFRRGCAFYELTSEEEVVSEDQELILQKKVVMLIIIIRGSKTLHNSLCRLQGNISLLVLIQGY